MRLGLGLGGLGLDSQGLIDQAKAHGVSGILMDISEVRKQSIADWRRQLAENGLEVVQVGAWIHNFLLPRLETEEIVLEAIKAAADLDAKRIILGGGTKNPNHSFCGHPDNFTDAASRRGGCFDKTAGARSGNVRPALDAGDPLRHRALRLGRLPQAD